jgi:hypothetical protein
MMKAAMAMLRVVIMGVSVELKASGPPNWLGKREPTRLRMAPAVDVSG